MLDRLRRVTDLFVEGTEAHFGVDDDGAPVLVWINKLNSFEVEEARQDGLVARGLSMMRFSKEDNPERLALESTVAAWSEDQLIDGMVNQKSDELYLDVLNDLEADPEWSERMSILRRLPSLLADSQAPEDDPRRAQLYDLQTEYLDTLRKATDKATEEARQALRGRPRKDLEAEFFENWRSRASLDDFMAARRVTEMFFAMRDCAGTEAGRDAAGRFRWDHSKCDHSRRLLNERSQVRLLPEAMLAKITDVIEEMTVPPRESGNSAAPRSSSASVGQQSAPEDSTPSTPEGTPLAAPMT